MMLVTRGILHSTELRLSEKTISSFHPLRPGVACYWAELRRPSLLHTFHVSGSLEFLGKTGALAT